MHRYHNYRNTTQRRRAKGFRFRFLGLYNRPAITKYRTVHQAEIDMSNELIALITASLG